MKNHCTNDALDKQPRVKACTFAIKDGFRHSGQFRAIEVVSCYEWTHCHVVVVSEKAADEVYINLQHRWSI